MAKTKNMKGEKLEGYVSVEEFAAEFELSRWWVYKLIEREKIAPVNHIGGTYVIPDDTANNYRKEREEMGEGDKRYKKV